MPGHTIEGTPIAVDLWDTKLCPQAKLFFLTHFHSDHTIGLTRNWQFPIYASPLTCKFVATRIGVPESLLFSLECQQEHLIPLDVEEKEMLVVTLYDANHCPGAVMYLFQGYFGNILYTGDFRYVPGIVDFPSLPTVDVLYVDNTYCSPKCTFPTYEKSVDAVLEQLHGCLQKNKRVFLGLDSLGKEELLKRISKETHAKIWANAGRKEMLKIMGLKHIITSEVEIAKVLIVPTNHISVYNIGKWNREMPTCAILPTARFCGFNFTPYSNQENIHVIPLSNHSSYAELFHFIKIVCPRRIMPMLGANTKGIFGVDISNRADMSVFHSLLNPTARADFTIPQSVHNTMCSWVQSTVNRQSKTYKQKRKGTVPHTKDKKKKSQSSSNTDEAQKRPMKKPLWKVTYTSSNGQKSTWTIS